MKILLLLLLLLSCSISFAGSPLCVVKTLEGKWQFIDTDGNVFKERDDIINYGDYREGRHRVKMDFDGEQKWAFLDEKGEFLFSIDYQNTKNYYEDMAMVSNDTRDPGFPRLYGFIDREGNTVVEPQYKDAIVFQEDLAYVMNDSIRGYINKKGDFELILPDSLVGYRFSGGIASVADPSYKIGMIDKQGNLISEFLYDEASYFSEGLSKVNFNGQCGVIDTSGKIIVPFEYYDVKEYNEGRTFISVPGTGMKNMWALVDRDGNFLTKHNYEYVNDFSQGLAAVKDETKGWLFLTKSGEEYLEMEYRFLSNFAGEEELAWASILVNYDYFESGFIDKTGEFIVPIENYMFAWDLRLNKQLY